MSFRKLFWLFTALLVLTCLILVSCTDNGSGSQVRTQLVTVPPIIITATPDPNVTPNVIIVTATFDRTQVAVPDDIVPEDSGTQTTPGFGVTQIADAQSVTEDPDSGVPSGCLSHTVEEGDTVFGVAEVYGVNPFLMLEVNGFTEETAFLNIGDVLVVPVEGCAVEEIVPLIDESEAEVTEEPEATAEVTGEATEDADLTPSPTPTVTLAPTAVDSEIEIVEVLRPGDVTAEGVRIRNNGRLVDVAGWTLSDADGNEFTFEELLIFSQSEHTVYTRAGDNVPVASYWGLEEAVWEPGDVVTLADETGDVQAVYRITSDDE